LRGDKHKAPGICRHSLSDVGKTTVVKSTFAELDSLRDMSEVIALNN
jgi:hypothetical protein